MAPKGAFSAPRRLSSPSRQPGSCKTTPLWFECCCSPMVVPSLSWLNESIFSIKWLQKAAFSYLQRHPRALDDHLWEREEETQTAVNGFSMCVV